MQVVAGEHELYADEGFEQARVASKIVRHPFNSSNHEGDIALVKVDPPFVFNKYVQPIDLPLPLQNSSGTSLIAGWGSTSSGGILSMLLRKARIPILTDEECRNSGYGPERILDSNICAGTPEGGRDSCQGDSGGPMVCDSEGGSPYLCGIVSWGNGCALREYPGVYTEVSYFTDWIKSNILS